MVGGEGGLWREERPVCVDGEKTEKNKHLMGILWNSVLVKLAFNWFEVRLCRMLLFYQSRGQVAKLARTQTETL